MQKTITYSPHYNKKINKIFDDLQHISTPRMARFLECYIKAIDTITIYANSSSNPNEKRLQMLNYKFKFFDEYVLIYRISNKNIIKMRDIYSQNENYQEYI
ncbi:type II toxin-antitoxin system RelE/ParE family toxin [Clostridium psychrophilum]|uniref:type II toxin-antitoxin system RelE/ParE family toxin n=1 Tax=Clostridium psychrophilum TaxID=132926 RepID=UPI001C0E7654|nr:type II toxin-antitoxin system RelE/ParE family toxin [Clostridium psychrophilum]MBU3182435.1 type II toxin-antitoxin system RelE/ParE family toxin [Clostridium psychrophilum]